MKALKNALPAIASALLASLTLPPTSFALLAFVAYAPWLASLRDTDSKGALKSGYLYGFLFGLSQMFWLVPFVSKWTGSIGLAVVPWLVTALIMGLWFVPMGWLLRQCWITNRLFLIPLVWAGHEAFRASVPVLAFPWGNAAHSLVVFPAFVQHAAFGTVFLVSAWVMLPNIVTASLVWPSKERPIDGQTVFRHALLFCSILCVSALRYWQSPATTKRVVTIGQPGIDMAFTPPEVEAQLLGPALNLIRSRAVAGGSELLVLPEGIAAPSPDVPPAWPLGDDPGVPVIFGGKRQQGDKTFQTAFAFDKNWSYADKTKLVVFGEYVPFRDLPFMRSFQLPSGDLSPGETVMTMDIAGMRVGPLICFEGVFCELSEIHSNNGAQMLAQMSIDDWYEGTPAHRMLWQSSVWRSIESGLPLVRAGGRGMSLATTSRGDIAALAPLGQMTALRVEVGVPPQSDAFPQRTKFIWVCWAICGLLGLEALVRWRRGWDSNPR